VTAGFIGLGHMGSAMAERLLRAGRPLWVHDLDATRVDALVAQGAQRASGAAEIARQCDLVLLCLPSPEASLAVCRDLANGGRNGERSGERLRVVVETSTVGPAAVRALAQVIGGGVSVVDAPVSGGPSGARAGTLAMMCAGSPAALEQARPWLDRIAGRRFDVGDAPGLAQVCKLVNNAISAAGMIAACEATLVGVKAGLDAGTLLDAINASSGRNAATQDKFPRAILNGRFDYGGPLGLMLKDLSLFNEQARELGVGNTIAPVVLSTWSEAVRRSGAQADYSEVIRHMEIDAGAQVRSTGRPA
jgi:3-hydroxyisobutyrate dehydrogenase-like beta-hydroxyacid dehydrogenase